MLLVVAFTIVGRGHARIVRRGEGDVGEEGLTVVVILQELDGGVGEQFTRELLADAFGAQLAVGTEVSHRYLTMVRHASKHNRLAALERAQPRRLPVVPLAGAERGVTVFAE